MAPCDIHNYALKLERELKKISMSETISPNNKLAIRAFVDHCFAEGLSKGRVLRYLFDLQTIAKYLGKDFQDAKKEDLMSMIAKLEQTDYAERTKRDFRIATRKLYQWLKGQEKPEEIAWMKIKEPKNRIRMPETLLTQEDVNKLIETANSPRDKAFLALLAEGFRIGEMFSICIKNMKQVEKVITEDGTILYVPKLHLDRYKIRKALKKFKKEYGRINPSPTQIALITEPAQNWKSKEFMKLF
ncbi:MAG: site-specific integrase [Candidatus Aenigmarchaeota archaeon]|nr:site-specific integrase [Candidatus Aenigmarchaeota archaeon]